MSDMINFEKNIIEMLAMELEKLKIPVKLYEPDEQVPVHMLVTVLEGLGKGKQDVKLELCFLPLEEKDKEKVGFNFLQFFASIKENIQAGKEADLLKVSNALNSMLPAGSIGVEGKSKTLYLKYCCPYTISMNRENIVSTTDAVLGMIIHTLNSYADVLVGVAEGRLDTQKALDYITSGRNDGEI